MSEKKVYKKNIPKNAKKNFSINVTLYISATKWDRDKHIICRNVAWKDGPKHISNAQNKCYEGRSFTPYPSMYLWGKGHLPKEHSLVCCETFEDTQSLRSATHTRHFVATSSGLPPATNQRHIQHLVKSVEKTHIKQHIKDNN